MEAGKEKTQDQRRKGVRQDSLLCKGYYTVLLLRKLESKWCLPSVPLQLRPPQVTARHRQQSERCSHGSNCQRTFNSLFWSALGHRLVVPSASSSTCCQNSKGHTVSVSYVPPSLPCWDENNERNRYRVKLRHSGEREHGHANHYCRQSGIWTGNQANPGSVVLLSKHGNFHWDISFTLPHITSLYTNTHSSDSNQPLLFYEKLLMPPCLSYFDFSCNWFTQRLHTMVPYSQPLLCSWM